MLVATLLDLPIRLDLISINKYDLLFFYTSDLKSIR